MNTANQNANKTPPPANDNVIPFRRLKKKIAAEQPPTDAPPVLVALLYWACEHPWFLLFVAFAVYMYW